VRLTVLIARLTSADKSLPSAEIDDAAWKRIKTRCDNALVERDNVVMDADESLRVMLRVDMLQRVIERALGDGTVGRPAWEPPLRWLLLLPAWRAMLDMDADDEGVEERIEELVDDYRSAVKEVRANAIATLAAVVAKAGAERADNESDADLVARASSVFRCSACKHFTAPLTFPDVLDHECSRVAYDYHTVKQADRPMRKMAMFRADIRETVETALEAASLNVNITAASLQTARFFISPAMQLGPGRQIAPELLAKTHTFYELVRVATQAGRR